MLHSLLEKSFHYIQKLTIFMSFGCSKSFSKSLSVQLTVTLDPGGNGRLATCPLTCVAWEARTDQGIHFFLKLYIVVKDQDPRIDEVEIACALKVKVLIKVNPSSL